MPPKAFGDRPLTNAERQARHRAARAASRPVIHYQPVTGRRSRARRWRDAVAELVILQSEYAQCATGEALQATVDLDLDELIAVVPPRGFGRD
jgi:hypothetical protein